MQAVLSVAKFFSPEEFLGNGWTIWNGPIDGNGLSGKEDVDSRSLALTKINPDEILFEAYPKEKDAITGEERLKRLKAKPNIIRLGGNVFLALWRDYQTGRRDSILEYLYKSIEINYFDFPGSILRSSIGRRSVLCLSRGLGDNDRWNPACNYLDVWNKTGPSSAFLACNP